MSGLESQIIKMAEVCLVSKRLFRLTLRNSFFINLSKK